MFVRREKSFSLVSVSAALQQLPSSVRLSVTFFHVGVDADVDVDVVDADVVDVDARVWKKSAKVISRVKPPSVAASPKFS